MCRTVEYAHSKDVLHRDIKPANILVGDYGEVFVMDWGIAKPLLVNEPPAPAADGSAVEAADANLRTIGPMGTPAYMSPEQAENAAIVGKPSDIYSLGATLYHLLTGQPSLTNHPTADPDSATVVLSSSTHETADRGGGILERVKAGRFIAPRQVNAAVPPALEAICLKAMSLRPENRYATAGALADDIEHWLADEPVSCCRETLTVRARRWLKRHRTLATTGLTTLLAVFVMLAGFLVRLNVEKHKLEEANAALQAAQDDLKATNENLKERNRQLKAARDEAERNLQQAVGQIEETMVVFARPDIVVYRHDPVYGQIQEILADQLDRFVKNVPKNEFGEKVKLLRDNQRLWMMGIMQRADVSAGFQEQLAITRAGLRDYLRKHPADTWAEFNLAKTYIIEAQRRSLTKPGDEGVAKLLFDAFDLLERHATLSDPYGKESAFSAAGTVALLSAGLDGSHGTESKAKVVLDRAEKTLSMLDRFVAAAVKPGEESSPYERYLDCLARLQVLGAKGASLRWLKDRGGDMRAAAEAALATAAKCPQEWSRHPYVLRFRAIASGQLAEVAMQDKQHAQAWNFMRQECDLMRSSLENIPGQLEDTDRRWVRSSEIALALVGLEVLRSSDRRNPAARAELSAIARDALAALDTCANAEALVPAAQRDPKVAADVQDLREKLHKYQAELDEKGAQ